MAVMESNGRKCMLSSWLNWIERRPPEPKVTGSNPVGDTQKTWRFSIRDKIAGVFLCKNWWGYSDCADVRAAHRKMRSGVLDFFDMEIWEDQGMGSESFEDMVAGLRFHQARNPIPGITGVAKTLQESMVHGQGRWNYPQFRGAGCHPARGRMDDEFRRKKQRAADRNLL